MRATRRRSLSILVVIGLTLVWAALAFAAGSPARAGTGHVVEISGFAYDPPELTITAGEAVTWTNLDAVEHTATATDGSWDTGLIDDGGSATITFTAPGTYDYRCTPHPSMTGRIVVEAAAASATPAPSSAPSSGGALPDVAVSAGGGSSTLLTLAGTGLLGLALLLAGAQAVRRGFGEPTED